VLLARDDVPQEWLQWDITAPGGGSVEILQAAMFDSTGQRELDSPEIRPVISPLGEEAEFSFSPVPGTFILVVVVRETFPNMLIPYDTLRLGETLPIWEETVSVKVPGNSDFTWTSNAEVEPDQRIDGLNAVYEWQFINQLPEFRRSLRKDRTRWLSFGPRGALPVFLKTLNDYASVPAPEPPSEVRRWIGQGARGVGPILTWLGEQPEPFGTPRSTLRSSIPEQAPWSHWEKTVLALHWIGGGGMDTRMFWRLFFDPESEGMMNDSIILTPVVRVANPSSSKDVRYYEIGQDYHAGESSFSLSGLTLYSPQATASLTRENVPQPSTQDNRLSIQWNLDLTADGETKGTVKAILRGQWLDFLLSQSSPQSILEEILGRSSLEGNISTRRAGNEFEIEGTLTPTRFLRSTLGSSALAPIPPVLPSWVTDLDRADFPLALQFPFILESLVSMKLASNVQELIVPPSSELGMGRVRYSERHQYNRRQRVFEASARIVVSTASVGESLVDDFRQAISRWYAFCRRSVPIKIRV
jgi:hypothetical protein